MTALAATFGFAQDARVYAGSNFAVRVIIEDGSGIPVDLTGRLFALVVFNARTEEEVISRSAMASGSHVDLALLGDETRALRDSKPSAGYRLQIMELLDTGTDIITDGVLSIVASSRSVVPSTSGSADAPIVEVVRTGDTRQVSFRSQGSPGLSAAQLAFMAGLIEEPTGAALTAYLRAPSEQAGADAMDAASLATAQAALAEAAATLASAKAALADAAATAASAAAGDANAAAALANAKAALADAAATLANAKASLADSKATLADQKAALAQAAADAATASKAAADAATALANTAAGAANTKAALADTKAALADAKAALAQTAADLASAKAALADAATTACNAATAAAVTATNAANAAATGANNAAAQVNLSNGPSLLIKPGTGTFPALADAYFTGAKSLYRRFDGNAMQLRALTDIVTPARGSTATYYDATGTLQTAAAGVLRLAYRYNATSAQWVLGGLIVEPQASNFLLQSRDMTQAAWTSKARVNPTATALIEDATAAQTHYIGQPVTGVNGSTYTASVVASERAGSAKRYLVLVMVGVAASGANVTAVFDLATGTVTSISNGTAVVVSLGTNGWLCSVSYTLTTGTSMSCQLRLCNVNNSPLAPYDGDGVSGLNLTDFQIEAGSTPTSRIPTTTAQATRAGDALSSTLGPEFNPAAQTALFKFRTPTVIDHLSLLWRWDDTTDNNRIFMDVGANGSTRLVVVAGNNVTASRTALTLLPDTDYKIAIGFSAGAIRVVINGTAYADQVPTGLPSSLTRRTIGSIGVAAQAGGFVTPYLEHPTNPLLTGSEYPRLLSVAEMQAMTA